ncbi:Hypothetical protein FKW44_013963, partial [Caligus rogercresseyi]
MGGKRVELLAGYQQKQCYKCIQSGHFKGNCPTQGKKSLREYEIEFREALGLPRRVASEMDSGREDEDQEDDGEEYSSGKELPSESQQRRKSGLPLRNGRAAEQQGTEHTARLGECVEEEEIHLNRTIRTEQKLQKVVPEGEGRNDVETTTDQ